MPDSFSAIKITILLIKCNKILAIINPKGGINSIIVIRENNFNEKFIPQIFIRRILNKREAGIDNRTEVRILSKQ
ncbi:hypothetical protein MROS_2757 [Melioribacter roseus P3M-2]|uniref:Uncharacterized protein n=1 Tax=Melioribacter roseus (strain DSM 23840 / JCM 17771 / VKM B-2668 / P3M-2) TaxID=1191523 RepID=I6YZK1_MELRP|nr:hypothetical protein MROS_2757 [Melioribacter roseus P3M-2]